MCFLFSWTINTWKFKRCIWLEKIKEEKHINEHFSADERDYVIAQYQSLNSSSRYLFDLDYCPGQYRHPLADPQHIYDAAEVSALNACEKNVAVVRRRFLRCRRRSVFVFLIYPSHFLFKNHLSDRISIRRKISLLLNALKRKEYLTVQMFIAQFCITKKGAAESDDGWWVRTTLRQPMK